MLVCVWTNELCIFLMLHNVPDVGKSEKFHILFYALSFVITYKLTALDMNSLYANIYANIVVNKCIKVTQNTLYDY
jgi:hypothetical protein